MNSTARAGDREDRREEAELDLDLAKVCYIMLKARELDAKEEVVEPDYASNASDDGCRQVLEAYADDPTFDELKEAIDDLGWDEQCRLVALTWLGRGTFAIAEWDEAVRAAQDEHTDNTSLYLIGIPLLSDYIEEGLAAFGLSCEEFEMDHL